MQKNFSEMANKSTEIPVTYKRRPNSCGDDSLLDLLEASHQVTGCEYLHKSLGFTSDLKINVASCIVAPLKADKWTVVR